MNYCGAAINHNVSVMNYYGVAMNHNVSVMIYCGSAMNHNVSVFYDCFKVWMMCIHPKSRYIKTDCLCRL